MNLHSFYGNARRFAVATCTAPCPAKNASVTEAKLVLGPKTIALPSAAGSIPFSPTTRVPLLPDTTFTHLQQPQHIARSIDSRKHIPHNTLHKSTHTTLPFHHFFTLKSHTTCHVYCRLLLFTRSVRVLRLRPFAPAHRPYQGPHRRHAHHIRGQCVSLPDRGSANEDAGDGHQ